MPRVLRLVVLFALLLPLTVRGEDSISSDTARFVAEQKVREFLEKFIDADKTPEEQAALFTDDAEYYDQGTVGKAAIRRDVERYSRHWPHRHYTLTEISHLAPEPTFDRVFVAYTIDFEVANRTRRLTGQAVYGAIIIDLQGEPRVAAIREIVTQRGRQP